MRNRKRNNRKGWLKGIPKPRRVFGRLRIDMANGGDTMAVYVVEMQRDGLHIRQLRSDLQYRVIAFTEMITAAGVQPDLFPVNGEGEPEQRRAVEETNKTKETYGSIKETSTENPEGSANL